MASSSTAHSPLLYSCIAYENTVLCEHTSPSAVSAQSSNIASLILPKISHSSPEKRTYVHGTNQIHYIADAPPQSSDPSSQSAPGLTYLVVARDEVGRKVPFGFLLEIKQRLLANHAAKDWSSLPAYGMAAFNSELGKLMVEYGTSKSGQEDAFKNVQTQIDDVRGIMTENIERVLERGERIDLLVDKTDKLGGSAQDFRFRSRNLKRQLWWKVSFDALWITRAWADYCRMFG